MSRESSVTPDAYGAVVFCLACTVPATSAVCPRCATQLQPAPDTVLDSGLLVIAAYTHDGPARRLVHALKYRGVVAAARPFAAELARRMPASARMIVPMPRALARSVRYGVDPAGVLASALSALTGLPAVQALHPPVWWRRHAGAARGQRAPIRFRQRLAVPRGAVLVDDVVTTGATATAAAAALEGLPALVLAATVSPRMKGGESPSGGRVTGAPASGTKRPDLHVPPPDDVFGARRG